MYTFPRSDHKLFHLRPCACMNCKSWSILLMIILLQRPVGVVQSGKVFLPDLLLNLRPTIVWRDWSSVDAIVSTCASAANLAGYNVFGVEYWGELLYICQWCYNNIDCIDKLLHNISCIKFSHICVYNKVSWFML
jgi:hypothetical protein